MMYQELVDNYNLLNTSELLDNYNLLETYELLNDRVWVNNQLEFIIRICFEMLFIFAMTSRLYKYIIFNNFYIKLVISFALSSLIQTYIFINNTEQYYYVVSYIFITEHQLTSIMNYIIKCIEKTLLIILFFLIFFK